jgi:type I restriction enzyme S subunit
VGVIPEDWEVQPLGELVKITSGDSPSLYDFTSSGFPYFKVEQLGNSEKYLGTSSTRYHFQNGKTVTKNSVVFAKRGAAIALNKVRLFLCESFMDTNLMALTPNDGLDSEFLYYALTHVGLWRFADTTSVPQINNKHVIPLLFVLPPPPEQRAIAEALSDVDGLIAALGGMIAKKRDLKHAAMQQLLTGKTRLPGFSGEWEVKRLGDHVRFLKNGTLSRAQLSVDGSVQYLHYGDIHSAAALWLNPQEAEMPFVDLELVKSLDRLEDGDVVYVDASEDLDGVGKSIEIQDCDGAEVVAGLHTIAARYDKRVLADGFKAYLQFVPAFRDHLRSMAAGTKVLATNRKHIAGVEMAIPSTSEQTAIAEVLSDMDADLAALEAQADKARAVKQGMMQQLLTGKVRLV